MKEQYDKKLSALSELFEKADLINNACNFKPDFLDFSQKKYFPVFKYSGKQNKFVFEYSERCLNDIYGIHPKFCFNQESTSDAFAKTYIKLFNDYLL